MCDVPAISLRAVQIREGRRLYDRRGALFARVFGAVAFRFELTGEGFKSRDAHANLQVTFMRRKQDGALWSQTSTSTSRLASSMDSK